MGVVEPFDVVEERRPCFGMRAKPMLLQQFALQGREEGLGDGVVVAIPRAPTTGRSRLVDSACQRRVRCTGCPGPSDGSRLWPVAGSASPALILDNHSGSCSPPIPTIRE